MISQSELGEMDFFQSKLESGYGFDRTIEVSLDELEGEAYDMWGVTDAEKAELAENPLAWWEKFIEMSGYGMMSKTPLSGELIRVRALGSVLKAARFLSYIFRSVRPFEYPSQSYQSLFNID